MAKQKEAWDKLSMLEKALLIKLSVDNGVSSLKLIRDTYNLYSNGGNLVHKKSGKELGEIQELHRIPEVSIIEEPWADAWFKDNKNVAGMAIGKGLNGVDGERRVIINPYNTQMNDSTSRASVLLNERLRHVMDQENFSLPNITKELLQKYDGTSYLGDTLNIGRTEVARYLSGDPSHNLTNSLKLYVDSLKSNYKKSTGGPLYPFSFEKNPYFKTPVVRYDEGGHLFGFGDWLLNLFNTNKSLQLKLLVEDQTWQSLPDTIITTPKTNLNADISSIANTVTPGIHTDMLTTRGGFNTFNKFNIGDNDIYAVDKENKLFIPLDKKLYIDNMRPRLDYIGGDKDLTRKQAIEVFGLWPSIVDVANLYLLSPDLLARRLSKEGFLDTYTDRYNQYSNKELQKTMQNNPQLFWDSEVNSYNDFGLDTVLLDYIDGNISILDLNVKEFYDDLIKNNKYTQGSNEKGDATLNFNGSVLQLFHLQAAYFKYLESIYNARRKLGLYENIDLDTFLNAAYNLGIYNDDLQNAEWVNKNYKVPSWYTK